MEIRKNGITEEIGNSRMARHAVTVMRGGEILMFLVGFLLLFSYPVHAYIDPSVMTYAIQATAGLVIASGTFLGILWRRLRKRLMGGRTVKESRYHQFESDEVEFHDPAEPEVTITPDMIPYSGPIKFNNGETKNVEIREKDDRPPHKLKWSERVGDIVPIALLVTVTFGLFIPSSLYIGNINEFIFEYVRDVLPLLIGFSCAAFVLIELVISLFPGRLYLILSSLVFSIGLGFYVQGNFLNPKFAYLNGTAIEWSEYAEATQQSTMVWGALILIPLILVLWKPKMTRLVRSAICVYLSAVQIVSLCYMDISTTKQISSDVYVTKVGEWEVSKNNNTIIFLVDTLDAVWFENYVMTDARSMQYLKDFTYYNDCVGGGAPTLMGVPLLFTGQNYMSDKLRADYYKEAYEKSHLFRDLVASGDKVKLYTSYEYISMADVENIANVEPENNFVIGNDLKFSGELYKLAAFYAMPMMYKEQFWLSDSAVFNKFAAAVDNEDPMFTEDDPQMRTDYDTNGPVTAMMDEDLFVFYHMFGAHGPARMNEEGKKVPDSFTEEGRIAQIHGCFNIIFDYIDDLKKAGVYDTSTFIIMADHGGLELYQNPAVLIKKPSETHDSIVTSDAPIIFQNIRATVAKSLLTAEEMTEDYGKAADEVTAEDNKERIHTATRVLGAQLFPGNRFVMTKEFSVYRFFGKARDLYNIEVLPIERFDGEHE